MNDTESRVLETIDYDGMLDFLCELIAIPSVSGQETAAQERMAAQMERCGLSVDCWQLDLKRLREHPQCSIEIQRDEGLGLVGALGQDAGGRCLILNGHVDVVPAGDPTNWRFPPWQGTLAGGRVYGRGAVDMKGGLCCALYAAKALHDAGAQLDGRLFVESVIGEEDGGVGTLATILRGYRADGAIVVEPTQFILAPAQAGALSFRVTVPGRAAHGAYRAEGISAIEKFLPVHDALIELERARNSRVQSSLFNGQRLPYALSIGKVQAGDWASSVPESLEFEGRYGVAVGEDLAQARQAFEAAVARAAETDPWLRDHPPVVEWWGGQFEPAGIPADHPLVKVVGEAHTASHGSPPRIEGMPYGADMRLLVNVANTPTVLYGPGDVRTSHRPDEYVLVDDLFLAVRTLALAALRFCGQR